MPTPPDGLLSRQFLGNAGLVRRQVSPVTALPWIQVSDERGTFRGRLHQHEGTSYGLLAERLLDWYRSNRRDLPWRGDRNPYRIWVSEIMLQQTRVETVLPYYERFLTRYPDVESLAAAPQQDILASWAGLGYYRRARMMHEAARLVVDRFGGRWPAAHAAMRALPGVGEYTAAAISSIAFDEPRAALDGNAFRVLARLSDERRDIRRSAPRRSLSQLGQTLIESTTAGQRGAFTQALMELGATVCVPRVPQCTACPWSESCKGFVAGSAPNLPSKSVRRPSRTVEISVAIARRDDRILVRQRPADASVMPGFWELPSVEGSVDALLRLGPLRSAGPMHSGAFAHAITDTRYDCRVYEASARSDPGRGYRWMSLDELSEVPLATISRKALRLRSK